MGNIAVNTEDVILDDFQLELASRVLNQLDEIGQSALEVMTSGGKSYIAAHIIGKFIGKHRDKHILWIAPKAAINNVKNKILSKLAIRNKIIYLGYEELSRGNIGNGIDESDISLVIFDECHRAYAKKTYQTLDDLLNKLQTSNRLAMSATPKRYGGVNTFDILVPKVDEPITFDLKEAALHDLLPNVKYVLANTSISKSDFEALDKYKDLAKTNKDANKLYSEVLKTLTDFKFDLRKDLGDLLKNNIKSTGEYGDRHIAFFSSIETLQKMHSGIEDAFNRAYPNCEINVMEYHSGLSDIENQSTFKKFVLEDAVPNRIDVMLSVDKATESVHPDNIRSVLMFRETESLRVYLQQMGRGIMLKSYHPDDIVVFDFADNIDCVGNRTIRSKEEFTGSKVRYTDTIEGIRKVIASQFGYTKGLETIVGLNRISNALGKLRRMQTFTDINKFYSEISKVLRVYKGLVSKGICPGTDNIHRIMYNIVEEVEITETIKPSIIWEDCKSVADFKRRHSELYEQFKVYQDVFLSSEESKNIDGLISQLFKILGHSGYLVYGNGVVAKQMLEDIDYIKCDIEKNGSIENTRNPHAKNKLSQLRLEYAKRNVYTNILVYAKRHNIDIELAQSSMTTLQGMCEDNNDKVIFNQFKGLIKALESAAKDVENNKDIDIGKWLICYTKAEIFFKLNKGSSIASILLSYANGKYGNILDMYKLDEIDTDNGNKLIGILNKFVSKENSTDEEVSYTMVEEDYIFNRINNMSFSEYEHQILREFKTRPNECIEIIKNQTEFMRIYKLAKSGDAEALKELANYNKFKLDKIRIELINGIIKQGIVCIDEGSAEAILRKARLMYNKEIDYTDTIDQIEIALQSGVVDQLDVALVPFKKYEHKLAIETLTCTDETFREYGSNLAIVSPFSIIVTRCSQRSSFTLDIINNILKIKGLNDVYRRRLLKIVEESHVNMMAS